MNLTDEDFQKIAKWMNEKYPNYSNCEFCQCPEGMFAIAKTVFRLPVFYKNEELKSCNSFQSIQTESAPMILLFCVNCENSKLFNAMALEAKGCPGINILPPKPKKNVLSFFDFFKGKK